MRVSPLMKKRRHVDTMQCSNTVAELWADRFSVTVLFYTCLRLSFSSGISRVLYTGIREILPLLTPFCGVTPVSAWSPSPCPSPVLNASTHSYFHWFVVTSHASTFLVQYIVLPRSLELSVSFAANFWHQTTSLTSTPVPNVTAARQHVSIYIYNDWASIDWCLMCAMSSFIKSQQRRPGMVWIIIILNVLLL